VCGVFYSIAVSWRGFTIYYQPFLPNLLHTMHLFNRYTVCCLLLFLNICLYGQENTLYTTPVLKPTDRPADKLGKAVFLRLVASKNTVYAGEPILVEYKLYMSVLDDPSPGKEPSFSGCSVVEMPSQTSPVTETINNRLYNVITVRKVQLTPLQDGPLVLPDASINNIIQYTTTDSPFVVRDYPLTAACQPLTINVKPLPEKDKPAGFSGLVGSFGITAKIDTNAVPANDNTHLTIVIKGAGNISAINMPAVQWPANTEHFDAIDTQHSNRDTFPVSGDKIFNIPFIGTKQGTAIIPPVSFSYFDPVAEKYITVHSDSLPIRFTGPLPKAEQKEIITEDITNRKYLWIVPAIALVVAFVLIITGKNQRKEKRRREQEKLKEQMHPVIVLQPTPVKAPAINFTTALQTLAITNEDRVFFIKAKEVLTAALQQKFNLASLQETGILAEMQTQNTDAVLYENARHIYKICNLCLYSPVIDEGQRVLVMEALGALVMQLGV